MREVRDNQRSKVYKTERLHSFWNIMWINDIKDIQRLISFIRRTRLSPWKHQLQGVSIKVTDGRRRRNGVAIGNVRTSSHCYIRLPKSLRRYIVVLHELAHLLTPKQYASHGQEYCTNYLYLIRQLLGEAAYEEMIALFKAHNVNFDYGTYTK